MTVSKKAKKEAKAPVEGKEAKEEKYRPSKEVLELFYGLPELDKGLRHKAVANLLTQLKQDPTALNYCVERLVSGLSSPRAAARVGFSTALAILLASSSEEWTAERLFELADKKMDLKDKDFPTANAIGHHLLATVLVDSGAYSDSLSLILERELSIYRHFPVLAVTVGHSIGELSLSLDTKKFKTIVLPSIKEYLEGALQGTYPEFLHLIFMIREKHFSVIHEHVSFIQRDGSCKFENVDLDNILGTVKKCNKAVVNIFLTQIIDAARAYSQFDAVYKNVIEKWASSGDESKVLERIFSTAELALQGGSHHKEVISVFSDALMKRLTNVMTGKQGPQQKMLRSKISSFCDYINERLSSVTDSSSLLELISHLDRKGSFDQVTGSSVVEKLVSRLDQPSALKWVQSLKNAGIRRVGHVFPQWSSEAKKDVLVAMVAGEASEERLLTVANAVDSLFYVKVRPSERVVIKLSEENEEILRSVVDTFAQKDIKKTLKKFTNETLKRPLSILYNNVKLWEQLSPNAEDKTAYKEALQEITTIASSSEEQNVAVLIDLLISLLSRPHKFIRTVVYFVFVHLLPNITSEEVNHITEALAMEDAEMGADEEGEDDADMEVDEDADENEDDDEEEEDVSEESEDEDDADIDPLLVSKLEQALGKAAVKRNEDGDYESDASLSDMDDEAMFAMDERLSQAFKAMAPGKEKKEKTKAMQEFRSKVTDLLLFTVSATETPADVKLSLIVPLLKLCLVQLKREADGTGSKRTIELLDMIARQKKISTSEKKTIELLKQLVAESANLVNPVVNATVASLTAFVFSLGISEGGASAAVKAAFLDLFNQFLTQEEGNISSELATAAIIKYPAHFVSELPTLVKAGFNEEIRVFRRMEALLCVVALLNKAVVKVAAADKAAIKKLGKQCGDYLSGVVASPSEVKPRFFAAVLKTLNTAAGSLDEKNKEVLEKATGEILEQMAANEQLWKDLKKCNSVCMQNCGKQPQHVVKAILKSFQ